MAEKTSISGFVTTSDKERISYSHYKAGHREAVVIAPGFFVSKESVLLNSLKDSLIKDFDVIMFDFRGHGKSSGLFSWTSKEANDLEAILDNAAKQYPKVGLIGFSLGAVTSINVVSKTNKVSSLVAVSAPASFEKIDFRLWELDPDNDIVYNLGEGGKGKGVRPGAFWLDKTRPIDVIGRIKVPVLFVTGDKDWVVSHKHSQEMFERAKCRKDLKIIKGGPHAEYLMRRHSKELMGSIIKWLDATLKER